MQAPYDDEQTRPVLIPEVRVPRAPYASVLRVEPIGR